jgi:hypothetical protein
VAAQIAGADLQLMSLNLSMLRNCQLNRPITAAACVSKQKLPQLIGSGGLETKLSTDGPDRLFYLIWLLLI